MTFAGLRKRKNALILLEPLRQGARQPASLALAQPRVTRRGPLSISAARVSRRCLQVITLHRLPHLQQPESLATSRVTDSVTDSVTSRSLRVTDSVTRHRRCAKAEVCVFVCIWNTLIAIFGAPISPHCVYL